MSKIDPELFDQGVRFHVHESKPDFVPDEPTQLSELAPLVLEPPWRVALAFDTAVKLGRDFGSALSP